MELATGGTLRELIKKGEPLRPLSERLADAEAAISGLAAIHEAGIVHRDVKPDNMLRMGDGRLALSDFGLATDLPTEAGVTIMVGTPHYMAPEVRAGEPATTRSDVWSLGVVLYEIFFGKRPERRSSLSSEGMSKPPAPLTSTPIERAMLALCERCLSENPNERPADAGVVASLFAAAQSSPRGFVRRKQAKWAAVACVGVVLGLAGVRGLHRGRAATSRTTVTGPTLIVPSGKPVDWTSRARPIDTVPGAIHCFSMLDPKTVRLIWGEPRRAEDVDIPSGHRRPAPLVREAFETWCPDRSPRGDAWLFTGHSSSGLSEIRYSTKPDASESVSLTPGAEPLWLPSGEEFLYSLDVSHPATFSLSTRTFSLLPDPGVDSRYAIGEKAVSPRSNLFAIMFVDGQSEGTIAVYGGSPPERRALFKVPLTRFIRFDSLSDDLILPDFVSLSLVTLSRVSWKEGSARHLGHYPGLELLGSFGNGDETILIGRQRTRDAWVLEGGKKKRLTDDGRNLSASLSPTGDLLLAKDTDDGITIWMQGRTGESRRVTSGPEDVDPQFNAGGDTWAYAEHARERIMICATADANCRALNPDAGFPKGLRFSPDGRRLAYVTQTGVPHLTIVLIESGEARQLSPAQPSCPPVWSGPSTIWALEGAGNHPGWVERDVLTGAKTGRPSLRDPGDRGQCWLGEKESSIPFSQPVSIETRESATLLELSAAELR
jgi:hypothetical protein